jgi:hypothetical protein
MSSAVNKNSKNVTFTLSEINEPCTFVEVGQSEGGFAVGVSGAASIMEIDKSGNVTVPGTLTAASIVGPVNPGVETENTVFAGPISGAAAVPTFRALVAGDIPDLSASYVAITAESANTVFAGPVTGSPPTATPTFRALVAADIPSLAASKITSGQIGLAQGGTGVDLSATGGATYVLAQNASHVVSARALIAADIPDLSGTYATKALVPVLYDHAGSAAPSGNNHIASGWVQLTDGTNTVTLTNAAVFANSSYVVMLTYVTPEASPGTLSFSITSGSSFTINSTDTNDSTSTVAWTAIGYNGGA